MSEIAMPTEDGTEVGQMHFGLPGSPHLCTHIWTGREWRPMLTDEDILRAEIARLKAADEKLRAAAKDVCWFDWSDNDDDAVEAIEKLRAALGGKP